MYTYYILRGTRNNQPIEEDGDISADLFPNADRSDGPGLIARIVDDLRTHGEPTEWEECDLTEEYFDREDTYITFEGRWQRRSETPWRKD